MEQPGTPAQLVGNFQKRISP